MEEEGDNQFHNKLEAEKKKNADWLAVWQFKKGQSGNPAGRPKGQSLKEYTREMLAAMSEEERQAFLHGIPKSTLWTMAEGNPDAKISNPDTDKKLEVTNEQVKELTEKFDEFIKNRT